LTRRANHRHKSTLAKSPNKLAGRKARGLFAFTHPFEPDRLMGYCVTIYFAKLLIFDKVLGLGTTDGLAGFASTTANLIVASYFAKRGFENVARIIKR
jgi:hypothetical protein